MLFTTATSRRAGSDLAGIEVFAGCTPRQLREIDRLVTRVEVGAGRVLCREGEIGRECFAVLAGRAVATVDGRPVGAIERGQFIGEIALLAGNGRRTAAVTAETPMTLLVLTPAEFTSVLEVAPSVAPEILREMTRRLGGNGGTESRAALQPDASDTRARERTLVS